MSESRRRSSRRGKRRTIPSFSVNDLVQIPRTNTGKPVIGRLVAKLAPPPYPRWLVSYENHKDEEIAEEAIGAIVGKVGQSPSSSPDLKGGETAAAAGAATNNNSEADAGSATSKDVTTRSTKKRASSGSSGKNSPGNANSSGNSSAEEAAAKTTEPPKKKKKGVSFSRSRSNSDVSTGAIDAAAAAAKEEGTNTTTTGMSNSKVSDREQRSRRRQALNQEEAFQAFEVPSVNNGRVQKRPLPPPNVKSGNGNPKKKSKVGGTGRSDNDVVKVKLLTGTLFLYRGIHRHVEFIPRV